MPGAAASSRSSSGRLYGEPVLAPGESPESVERRIAGIVRGAAPPRRGIAVTAALVLACAIAIFGTPAAFDAGDGGGGLLRVLNRAGAGWWLGLASGCLAVSAVLLLANVAWRCAVSRIAETAALLCAVAAGCLAWADRRSPPADALGLAGLLAVCASLWGVAMLPDLAALRDRAEAASGTVGPLARVHRGLALGWRGSASQWRHWVETCRSIALLGTLLAVAVQASAGVRLAGAAAGVAPDSLLPVTLLVAAVLSGSGLTAALVVAVRTGCRLDALITGRHLDILARLILVLGLAGLYCHAWDAASNALHSSEAGRVIPVRRLGAPAAWIVVLCGLLPTQVFWLARARRSGLALALVGALAAAGAFADHLAAAAATLPEVGPAPGFSAAEYLAAGALAASVGLFAGLFLLALRTLPIVSIAQMRQLVLLRARSGAAPVDGAAKTVARPAAGGITAGFATEAALAAAIRALAAQDRPGERAGRRDGYAPVPIPEAFEALRAPAHPMRLYALVGALIGGAGYLGLRLAGRAPLDATVSALAPEPAWPFWLLPSLTVATAAGALAVTAAFLVLMLRLKHAPAPRPEAGRHRFVLSVAAGSAEAERVARRLAALPDGRSPAAQPVPR